MGKKGKGHQGTCIKDTWTKPKVGVGLKMGGGCGKVVVGKWTQLYLNFKKCIEKEMFPLKFLKACLLTSICSFAVEKSDVSFLLDVPLFLFRNFRQCLKLHE